MKILRRILSAALATLIAVVAVAPPSPANAAIPATGKWYMLVNHEYEMCLSMNNQTSPSGAGTRRVYLAGCNANTPAQWWYFSGGYSMRNFQNFDGEVWELSGNSTTPSGGGAGTYGVYAAVKSSATGHRWSLNEYADYRIQWQNQQSGQMMSASHNSTYEGGTYRVYSANWTLPAPDAHLWRFWEHPSGRFCPNGTVCGRL